ncbi:MAG TPA: hypothetical protein VL017_03080 [Devosia sp.]|nr:hypothetical protein [Devosia sp.]
MTPDEATRQKALREAAQRDILDIEALSKSEAFNRYFVGQLNRIRRENTAKALTGATPEEREKARHYANLIDELSQMPAQHRLSAEKLLATQSPGALRPTQVG